MVLGFSPPIYYSGVGTVFPAFYAKAGGKAEGVLAYGANDPTTPGFKEYAERHRKMYNRPTEGGATGVYGMIQVLLPFGLGEDHRLRPRLVVGKDAGDLAMLPLGGRPMAPPVLFPEAGPCCPMWPRAKTIALIFLRPTTPPTWVPVMCVRPRT
jgi:hypothetical protein